MGAAPSTLSIKGQPQQKLGGDPADPDLVTCFMARNPSSSHFCHTTILREQQDELSLHLQFPVARTAFEAFPIKRILRRQPLEVSRTQERFGNLRAPSAHGPLAATPFPRYDVSGSSVSSSFCPMRSSVLLLHHFWPLEIPAF